MLVVVVMIVWLLDFQLPVQSVPIIIEDTSVLSNGCALVIGWQRYTRILFLVTQMQSSFYDHMYVIETDNVGGSAHPSGTPDFTFGV